MLLLSGNPPLVTTTITTRIQALTNSGHFLTLPLSPWINLTCEIGPLDQHPCFPVTYASIGEGTWPGGALGVSGT